LEGLDLKIKKLFKRRFPYSPVAFLGRKTTEKILGGHIAKQKKAPKTDDKQDEHAPCQIDGDAEN
jgi:hypothetical protein